MHRINIVLGKLSAPNARLIGDHDQLIPRLPQRAKAVGDAVDQPHLRGIAEVAFVVNQRVVAIEKNGGLHDTRISERGRLRRSTAWRETDMKQAGAKPQAAVTLNHPMKCSPLVRRRSASDHAESAKAWAIAAAGENAYALDYHGWCAKCVTNSLQ